MSQIFVPTFPLANGKYATGLTNAGVARNLIGVGDGALGNLNQITVDPNGLGVVFGGTIQTGAHTVLINGIGAVSTDGLLIQNLTLAAAGAQQWSPRLHFQGAGWKTNAVAASQVVDFIMELQPVQGTANPSGNLVISRQVNAAGYTAIAQFGTAINLSLLGADALAATTSFASKDNNGKTVVAINNRGQITLNSQSDDAAILFQNTDQTRWTVGQANGGFNFTATNGQGAAFMVITASGNAIANGSNANSFLQLVPTFNDAAHAYIGILLNVTNTASAASSTLQTLQVGGATKNAIDINGKTTNYASVATAGWGTPAIYGQGRSTAQVAAVASVASYAVGAADGSFNVSANVNVTVSTAHSFSVQVTYTDETNTAQTLTLSFSQLAGTLIQTITNVTGAGPYEGITVQIRVKASTTITIKTAGTFTTVTYNVEGLITQIA